VVARVNCSRVIVELTHANISFIRGLSVNRSLHGTASQQAKNILVVHPFKVKQIYQHLPWSCGCRGNKCPFTAFTLALYIDSIQAIHQYPVSHIGRTVRPTKFVCIHKTRGGMCPVSGEANAAETAYQEFPSMSAMRWRHKLPVTRGSGVTYGVVGQVVTWDERGSIRVTDWPALVQSTQYISGVVVHAVKKAVACSLRVLCV